LRAVGWFIIGFVTMWAGAWLIIDDRLKPAMQGQTIALVARVADFPGTAAGSIRFIVEQELRPDLPSLIRLSWYEPTVVPLPGVVWRLRVRLRQPHGYLNLGGFDYKGWLFRQRIGATGYVVSHKDNQRQSAIQVGWLARIRQHVVDRVTRLLPDDDAAVVLLAISVGARHRITREQWNRYAVTGISHLMAISGLHIGLAAGGVLALAWIFLALLCPRSNVRDMALLAAVVAAGLYASVSGFAVPARRAFLMALLAAAAVMLRRKPVAATLLSVPCLVLFFCGPGFDSCARFQVVIWRRRDSALVLTGLRSPSCDTRERCPGYCNRQPSSPWDAAGCASHRAVPPDAADFRSIFRHRAADELAGAAHFQFRHGTFLSCRNDVGRPAASRWRSVAGCRLQQHSSGAVDGVNCGRPACSAV
jgi:hypothetical protein